MQPGHKTSKIYSAATEMAREIAAVVEVVTAFSVGDRVAATRLGGCQLLKFEWSLVVGGVL